jgi:hypothetical protein
VVLLSVVGLPMCSSCSRTVGFARLVPAFAVTPLLGVQNPFSNVGSKFASTAAGCCGQFIIDLPNSITSRFS